MAQYSQPPRMAINLGKQYTATMNTTAGALVVELLPKEAPNTVNNLVFLAREGFYDGVPFHRVIKDFMIQGGDPTGTGAGGPGYTFDDEHVSSLSFDRPGVLAMANRGPNTNGSQFFITVAPTEWLNGKYNIFGRLVEGQAVLELLSNAPTDDRDRPMHPVVLQSIDIAETWPVSRHKSNAMLRTPDGRTGNGAFQARDLSGAGQEGGRVVG